MKTYTGAQLDNKIESFIDRKMDKFPELRKINPVQSNYKKDFLRSLSHTFKNSFGTRVHA